MPRSLGVPDIAVDQVHGDLVAKAWPLVEPLLQRGIDRVATDGSTALLRQRIEAGEYQLWCIYRPDRPLPLLAAAATYIRQSNKGSVVVIDTLGGHCLSEWMQPALERFEAMARAHGMTRIEIDGRPGWQRMLPGFSVSRVVLEKVLTDV